MLKEERYDKILEILDEETYTFAESLAKRLYVSLPTIRRDLGELAKRGLIIRSHGGAKKIGEEHAVLPPDYRMVQNRAEKRRICKRAAEEIKDGDIVFIDVSTSASQIADYLSEKRSITVVTNSIPLAVLMKKKHIKCYCTGGEIQDNSLGYAGLLCEEMIRRFNIDVAIFSSYGVTEEGMIVDPSLEETSSRRVAISFSKKSIFLCDRSKLGLYAPYNLVRLCDVDYVITDGTKSDFLSCGEISEKIIEV